ncbi:MAG: sialate O-acetylesterase [Verrucomicrobiales bacterium]|jgi:sialate O-acetylesterase
MKKTLTLIFSLLALAIGAQAQDLALAKVFGDHMVLQQGKPTSVFGTAPAGSEVTVEFAQQLLKATADKNGAWTVQLKALKTNAKGQTLKVSTGDLAVEAKDVLIGEVWMCSGQSNMAWTLNRASTGAKAAAAANYPNLRLFTTPPATAAEPKSDVTGGEWKICSPETAPNFSAVGFFFGRELLQNLDTPIGLVGTAWGGKPSEAFTSRETLAATPAAVPLLKELDARQAAYDPAVAQATYEKQKAAFDEKMAAFRKAKAAGEDPKNPGRAPGKQSAPNLSPNAGAAIYNQMIAPWNSYAIAGAIWYQGESNASRAVQYETIFPAMIADWRKQRGGDEIPFYLVQLANFKAVSTEPGAPDVWAELQNAQTLTLQKLPNTGMAIINDIGDAKDIHPGNKEDVGKRLSLWALAEHYGKDVSPVSGPIMSKHEVVDGGIRVHFDHVGEGLKSRDGEKLQRFVIAGEDKKWVWADAVIEDGGASVLVSSAEVPKPAAARYAWAANPEGANLVNSADLPASLFRTDDWPLSTEGILTLADSAAARNLANIDQVHDRLRSQGWEILFNAKDLTGWKNPFDYGEATVKNGEIHLAAEKKFFLTIEKKYANFQLVAEIHLPEGKANSGIMFRCHVEPGKVYGYQAECDGSDRRWSGGLYDEGRRQWIWPSTEGRSEEKFLAHLEESQAHMKKPEVAGALQRNGWNKYQITCNGDRIIIKVNNVTITDFRDDLDAEGFIGIQHHGEKGAVYRFRNIYIKPLD